MSSEARKNLVGKQFYNSKNANVAERVSQQIGVEQVASPEPHDMSPECKIKRTFTAPWPFFKKPKLITREPEGICNMKTGFFLYFKWEILALSSKFPRVPPHDISVMLRQNWFKKNSLDKNEYFEIGQALDDVKRKGVSWCKRHRLAASLKMFFLRDKQKSSNHVVPSLEDEASLRARIEALRKKHYGGDVDKDEGNHDAIEDLEKEKSRGQKPGSDAGTGVEFRGLRVRTSHGPLWEQLPDGSSDQSQ